MSTLSLTRSSFVVAGAAAAAGRHLAMLLVPLLAGCGGDAQQDVRDVDPILNPNAPMWQESAPDTFTIAFETSEGTFSVEVIRDWAPIGADRFYNLVVHGYYDYSRFYRVIPDFIVQFGLPGDPTVTPHWLDATIPDDPVRASNVRGTIAYAFTEPNTRTTQVYINLVDNTQLDEQGFAPFGRVTDGMDVVDRLYSGYGETAGGGLRRGDQSKIYAEGNAHLDRDFPELDRLVTATVVGVER